jgi:hypothetical protein
MARSIRVPEAGDSDGEVILSQMNTQLCVQGLTITAHLAISLSAYF